MVLLTTGCPEPTADNEVTVPNVVGMRLTPAETAIENVGLNVGSKAKDYSDTISKGRVISQVPVGGTKATEGASVSLIVSKGPDNVIGSEGGSVASPSGANLDIDPNQLDQEVKFELVDTSDTEIRQTLSEQVPYAGALTVDGQPLGAKGEPFYVDATNVNMAVTVPLRASLTPGTELDIYLKGDIPGQWTLLDVKAVVNASGNSASFVTNRIGTFIVREPDEYSLLTIDYDSQAKGQAKAPNESFVPALGFGLHRLPCYGEGAAGNGTIPIILIHGVGSHEDTQKQGDPGLAGKLYARWDNFITWAFGPDRNGGTSDDGLDLDYYQLWLFLHDSYEPVGYDYGTTGELVPNNVRDLEAEIQRARIEDGFPEAEQQFLIVAHSRGGLVARTFTELSNMGDQVMAAITLATPHHGSPLAVPDWSFHTLATHFTLAPGQLDPGDIIQQVGIYKNVAWWLPGYADLAWDNFDGTAPYLFGIPDRWSSLTTVLNGIKVRRHHLTTNDAGWPTDSQVTDETMPLPTEYVLNDGETPGRRDGATLWDLNHQPITDHSIDKFILYGAYVEDPILKNAFLEHAGLSVLNLMLGFFESESQTVSHFAANDGMVPIQSSLYLYGDAFEPVYDTYKPIWYFGREKVKEPIVLDADAIENRMKIANREHYRIYPGFDHLDMVEGKETLFQDIVADLDRTVVSVPTAVFSVTAADDTKVILDASGSHDNEDPTGYWPTTNLKYRFVWDVSNGLEWSDWQTSAEFEHTYPIPGTYKSAVQVCDQDGMIGAISYGQVTVSGAGTSWARCYGGTNDDYAYAVQPTSDGGYIIAGFTDSFGSGSGDMYLVKTDANGNQQWTQTFGGTSSDYGYAVQQTTDGGYVVAGTTGSFGAGLLDVYLVKTDANGNQQWSQTFGGTSGDYGYAVQQTSDGGYIIAGYTSSFGAGSSDVYLVKTDANGNQQWTRTFGGTSDDYAWSVQQTTDGGYILAGTLSSFSTFSYDMYLVKTDANGNQQWTQTFGGADTDFAWAVQQTIDGGYIIGGWTTDSSGTFSYDMYIVKTDGTGNQQWTRTFGGTSDDYARSVQQTSDGGYIIVGFTNSFGTGSSDMYIAKTDANGNQQWTRTFGGTSDDHAEAVQPTSDGGYIIAGITDSFGAGSSDMYVVKTDEHGNAPAIPAR